MDFSFSSKHNKVRNYGWVAPFKPELINLGLNKSLNV
jgi:hypothetical protein